MNSPKYKLQTQDSKWIFVGQISYSLIMLLPYIYFTYFISDWVLRLNLNFSHISSIFGVIILIDTFLFKGKYFINSYLEEIDINQFKELHKNV